MDTINAIKTRRSIREFQSRDVDDDLVREILGAGRWAPSGLNNQPWGFVVVRDTKIRDMLAKQTHYGAIIKNAPLNIAVFLDKAAMYDLTKDVLAIGACIQNMLLAAHSLGLGSVWLGEILKNKEEVGKILKAPESYELMAIIAVGYPAGNKAGFDGNSKREPKRKSLDELIYEG